MENNKALNHIFSLLDSMALSEAMDELETFSTSHPELAIGERLSELRGDYRLMFDYWSKGFKDAHLERVYRNMLLGMYRLVADTNIRYTIAHSSYLSSINTRVRAVGRDMSVDSVRSELESFVSNMAMLELEHENDRTRRRNDLFKTHQQFMNDLFDYLWTSPQWSDSMAEAIVKIALSPTVDTVDQQLIISAVMLGCMNMFDINKFRMLLTVYSQSTDEYVRQRALIGWAMSIGNIGYDIFADERKVLYSILTSEQVRKELVELQIQLFNCISAEVDNRTIQKEIMPDLLKHSGLNITLNGIEEKESDAIDDIINTGGAESEIDKVENSFKRMLDMQKSGVDIYFGGFSQMKRYPFFDSISNWFVPFYAEHPAIRASFDSQEGSRMIMNLVNNVPFCNSDKYSFVLAFKQVMDKIPHNIREMLGNDGVMGMESVSAEEQNTPAYIRRIYLQDLFRFFRLFPSRNLFYNPFVREIEGNSSNYLFIANKIFRSTALEANFYEVAACLMKRKMYDELVDLLSNYGHDKLDFNYYMLCGNLQLYHSDIIPKGLFKSASFCFAEALRLKPDSDKALGGYARAKFYEGEYAVAQDAYARLLSKQPENKSYELNMTVCMVNLGLYDEALKHLYKLNYENPDDVRINRVLAKALIGCGRYDKADKIYAALCGGNDYEGDDLINYGLCAWLAADNEAAARRFAEYIRMRNGNPAISECREMFKSDIVDRESHILAVHGITHTEIHLMSDLVCEVIFLAK